VRVDKFLQVSRLIKRRAVAKEAAESGKIQINGRVVKPGYEVKVGDRLEIQAGSRRVSVEILEIREHVPAKEAESLYRLV
jgi:ribosomal 50S subunit-recycling heat shock protein